MKKGVVVQLETLKSEGWVRITSFGNCYIYGKNDERILWNPLTQVVQFTFKNGG